MRYWYERSQDRLLGGAGVFSGYSDEAYAAKGCKVCSRGRALQFHHCSYGFPFLQPIYLPKLRQRLSVSAMRLLSLIFVLVASLVHSEEAQPLRGESKKPPQASGVKEETNGKEVTEEVGAVSNEDHVSQVPHKEGEGEDDKENPFGFFFPWWGDRGE